MALEPRASLVAGSPLKRWAWWLTVLTIVWNVVEAVVAIGGGVARGLNRPRWLRAGLGGRGEQRVRDRMTPLPIK